MKCAIYQWIFCLLAFCLFEAVFTDKILKEVETLRNECIYVQMKGVYSGLISAVVVAVDDAEQNGLNPDEVLFKCWPYDKYAQFSTNYDTRISQCNACYNEAAIIKNAEIAKSCCSNELAALKNDVKSTRAGIKTCVAKCVYEGQAAGVRGPFRRPRQGLKNPRNRYSLHDLYQHFNGPFIR